MAEIEKDLLKERILKEIYDKVGLTPTDSALDASHEAFSDELWSKRFLIWLWAISLIPDTEKEYELSKKLSLTAFFFALSKILYSLSTPNQIYNTLIGGDK